MAKCLFTVERVGRGNAFTEDSLLVGMEMELRPGNKKGSYPSEGASPEI